MIKKLRRRIIAVAMISTALVLIMIIGSINIMNYRNVITSADRRLQMLADNNGVFPEDAFPIDKKKGFVPGDHNPFTAETPFDTRYFSVTVDENQEIVATDIQNIAAITETEATEYTLNLLSAGKESGFWKTYRYGRSINDDGNTMYIFVDVQRELDTFNNFLWASVGISVLGWLLVFALIIIFSRFLVKPMAESYEKQKRFITDASHEIKTPLAIISANTEVLEMMGEENEWSLSIHHQVDRLTELTNKLVFLSRMDEEETNLKFIDFSLSDACQEEIEALLPVAESQGIKVECKVESGIKYKGDETYLRQVFALLTENAIKYVKNPDAREEAGIRINLYVKGKNIIFSIWNKTDELTPGNHPELFERFYRADKSRNSQTGGHGIGLSVAQAVVHAHKGKISASSQDGHSVEFIVTL